MKGNKEAEIIEKEGWIYVDEYRRRKEDNSVSQLYISGEWKNIELGIKNNETFCKTIV